MFDEDGGRNDKDKVVAIGDRIYALINQEVEKHDYTAMEVGNALANVLMFALRHIQCPGCRAVMTEFVRTRLAAEEQEPDPVGPRHLH